MGNVPSGLASGSVRPVLFPPKIGGFFPKWHGPGIMRLILRRFALLLAVSALGSPSAARAGAADDQFALAAEHYSHKRWQEACEAFQQLLEAHPDHARADQARFFYGEALAQLNRLDLARAQFGELLKRNPNHRYARQALFRSGEVAYLALDARGAKRDLEAFSERFPDDALNGYVLPYRGSLELHAGNTAAAQRLFSAALERFADGPLADECRLGLARAQEQSGHREQACRDYRAIVDRAGPLADEASVRLATLENSLGQHEAALATLDQLTAKSPSGLLADSARLGRGYALYKLGRHEEAEAVLAELLEQSSVRVEAHYWLGLAQKARRRWSAAAKTLSAGAKIDDGHRLQPALEFHAADAQLEDGQLLAARDGFDRAIARRPQGAWADDCLLGQLRIAAAQNEHAECVRLADELASRFPDSPLRPTAELAKGRALFTMGQYGEAIGPLQRVLNDKPPAGSQADEDNRDNNRALAGGVLALCYAKLGRFPESRRILTALGEAQAPRDLLADTLGQVAEAAFAAGEFDLARELFSGLVEPGNPPEAMRRGLSGLAWCHFRVAQWSEAAEFFDRLRNDFPDSPSAAEAALMRGRALEHLGQLEPALAMYCLVTERYATSDRVAEGRWYAALVHEKLRQPQQALELYGKIASDHADFAELDAVIYRRACLLQEVNDGSADELFARLRRDFPKSSYVADSTLRLAQSAVAAKKYDEAQTLLEEIAQPTSPDVVLQQAWHLQGRMAMAREQWDAVEQSLGQLIERFPDSQWAQSAAYLLGEASYRRGNYEQAVERLAALAKKTKGRSEPWSAMAELRRAQALAQMKEWAQALEIARAIAERFPQFDEHYEVDYLIGRALASQADFAAARESFANVVASPRGSATQTAALAQWMMGESYFHQENYAAALAEYAKVEARYPFPRWQSAAALQGGKCCESLGQWRAAVEAYERLLTTYPDSEFCAEATRRLAAAQGRAAGGSSSRK